MKCTMSGLISLVRPAVAADIPHIAEINEQARIAGYSDTGFIVLPLTAETVSREVESGEARYAVAEVADGIIGFVKYTTQAPDGFQGFEWTAEPLDLASGVYIDKLVVREDHRGDGIGTALYLHVAREYAGALLYTYVVASPCANVASMGFHEHRGFRARALATYEADDGTWFRQRLYVLTDPGLLSEAALRFAGFLTPLAPDGVIGALDLLHRELGVEYVTAEQLTGHTEGDDGSSVLVWTASGRVVGVGIACTAGTVELDAAARFGFEASGDVGCLQTLVVDTAYRRRGGGTALARQLLADLHARGHCQVLMFTWVSGRDHTADGVAEALGFTHLGALPEYWYEDSLEAGYDCPVCGNPCRCSVNVWALKG